MDLYLGLLAATLDRPDDAIRHLEDAVHINERMGARPWTAHSRADLAEVLRRRDAPGDRARADLEGQARSTANALGMTALAAKLEARRSPAEAAPTAAGRGIFHREGDYWSISLGGDAVRIKHSKGLAYLATLLGRPGQEIHALDLAPKAATEHRRAVRKGCASSPMTAPDPRSIVRLRRHTVTA